MHMGITARVSSGVQAIEVTIDGDGDAVTAVVTREALEEGWQVGPSQEDLLKTFEAHRDEICDEIVRRSQLSGRRLLALTSLKVAARPSQTPVRSPDAFR